MSVIETNNNTVIKSVAVGASPHALVFNPSNNNIYVTNRDSGTVSVIETNNNTVIKNVTVGSFPEQLLFNANNKNIYVANVISNSISVIDSNIIGNFIHYMLHFISYTM